MFEHHHNLTRLRGLMVAAWLAFLGGCSLPHNPAAPVPAGLAASAGDSEVTLNWTASTGATGYNLKRATASGGPYTKLASPTSPGYTDSGLTNGTTYYYVVSSLNGVAESGNSTQASATPKGPTVPPAPPTNLTATPGDTTVALTWTGSTGATSYYVKRSTTSGGPYTQIAAPTSTSYTDTGLTDGTTYYYVVEAVNAFGPSANSGEVSAIPSVPPPTTFGTWTDVTPTGIDLTDNLCGNFGATSIQQDPANPSNVYVQFNCQGIWKSADYGLTWTGPINTGTNGAAVACGGAITISPTSTATVPTIYASCIRGGNGAGFYVSIDGGVNWTNYFVAPSGGARQDYLPPVVDPYDNNHLLMVGHEQDYIVESVDGGHTWAAAALAAGMKMNTGSFVGTGAIFFINTGTASTTRGNWMWMGQQSGGNYGTWRTTNSGTTWAQVDKNEHGGTPQIYQPDNNGVVFMAGAYSILGWGVLRSTDYGQTWAHVGMTGNEAVVVGTRTIVYAMYGFPSGPGGTTAPGFEVASQPGTGTWVAPGTPAGMTQGTAGIDVLNDGTHNILVGAMFNNGVWRYVEP
jgi:hypothetical protein